MSTAMSKLSDNGEMQKIRKYWFGTKTCNPQNSDTEQIQLERFGGLFLTFGVVCALALLIYFCMIIHEFRKHYSDLRIGSRSLRRFLSFIDEKEEVSKNKLKRRKEMSISHVRARRWLGQRLMMKSKTLKTVNKLPNLNDYCVMQRKGILYGDILTVVFGLNEYCILFVFFF